MNHDPAKPSPQIEDLLRMKRAERPAADFWPKFEQEMRAKQLAAIMEPASRWLPLSRFVSQLGRFAVPAGVVAALALTLITVREYRAFHPSQPVLTPSPQNAVAAAEAPAAAVVKAPETAPGVEMAKTQSPALAAAAPAASAKKETHGLRLDANAAAQNLVAGVNADAELAMLSGGSTPFGRMTADGAIMPSGRPGAGSAWGVQTVAASSRGFAPAAPRADPLANVQSPNESQRLARLLGSALSSSPGYAANDSQPRQLADQGDVSISESRLYQRINRIGVRGSEIAIRF